MRRLLRPGTQVMRRGDGNLQIGLDPAAALVVPDSPGVRRLLRELSETGAGEDQDELSRRLIGRLHRAGLLVAEGTLRPALPTGPGAVPWQRHAVAAVTRAAGEAASAALTGRRESAVEVRCYGVPDTAPLADDLTELCRRAGLPLAGLPLAGSGRVSHRRVGALIAVGEPAREAIDDWMQDGIPHIVMRVCEGYAVVGPFVAPGRTACLRCLDAHRADQDPAWPLVLAQYSALAGRDRPDGVPEPIDPLLATVALAWALRDLASFVEGRVPATWSATLRLDPRITEIETVRWLRHPECGCSWA